MSCSCSDNLILIFPCSGASDLGALTDKTARHMTIQKLGKMYCLAGIGGKVNDILLNTQAAKQIIVIDGCKLHCAKLTLKNAGFENFYHLCLEEEFNMKKGETKVNQENINKIVEKLKNILK